MAVLVGVLLGLSRLAADSEITAMRAVGIGVWFFVRVVSVIAILGWGISLADSLYIAPKATAALLAAWKTRSRINRPRLRLSHASSMKTSRTMCCTCRISAPAREPHDGSASSSPT